MDNNELDEIGKLLEDYKNQKERRESENNESELAPPKEHIDFAAPKAEEKKPEEQKEAPKKEKKPNENMLKIKGFLFSKKGLIVLGCIVFVVLAAVGVKSAVTASKSAHIKAFESEYGIDYPDGMMKEYCNLYGKNHNTAGYIKIEDISFESPVYTEGEGTPSVKACSPDCDLQNFIVRLDTKELEAVYGSADGYNAASEFIEYSDLYEKYSFKVVGAFYTNTDPEDDNGYVFPYATPEAQTASSGSTFATDLKIRFLYTTSDSLSHKDRLLIIACPTDFREGFEFVVVCKLTDSKDKSTAKPADESRIHYPQVVYDDRGEENPYRLAHGWYPEIVINSGTNQSGEPITKTSQLDENNYN